MKDFLELTCILSPRAQEEESSLRRCDTHPEITLRSQGGAGLTMAHIRKQEERREGGPRYFIIPPTHTLPPCSPSDFCISFRLQGMLTSPLFYNSLRVFK